MKEKQEGLPAVGETRMREPDIVTAPEPDFLKQYHACYPKVKHFHVTGDNLVFLDRDYEQAVSHQQKCGKGELKTY